MVFIYKKISIISLLSISLLYSCNTRTLQNEKTSETEVLNNQNKYIIKGKTELLNFNKSFNVKSDNIGVLATVSLIYPNDYQDPELREATIATGLTDVNGNFIINPNFTPTSNQVLILESSKRYKGVGYASISLRTHIVWNGANWTSISGTDIKIDKKTTSIALLSALEPNILSSLNSINKITYNGSISTINYNSTFTESYYKKYYSRTLFALEGFLDPVKFYFDSSEERALISSVKANMHTLQTMLETYSVDWAGLYPVNIEALEQEAKEKKYWKELKNPFNPASTNTIVINDSEYQTSKNTLTFKGESIEDMLFFRGAVSYQPIIYDGYITKYFIYGVDSIFGDYIKDKDTYFVLSNG